MTVTDDLLPLWARPPFTVAELPAYWDSLAQYEDALDDPEGRRLLTRLDPLLFAITYFADHLRGPDGEITFAECHLEWCRHALDWIRPANEPAKYRRAYIAPREVGKSTWWFLILPAWAAAQGHARFAVAFADTAQQAETHLQTFKHETENNALLRRDYPMLCTPMERRRGVTVADNRALMRTEMGFSFAARGIDSSALGLKLGRQRPDLIILDDIEPDEKRYSDDQAAKRLGTILDAILPLNIRARVTLVGTVTMPGSITHQLAKHARGEQQDDDERGKWIREAGFEAYHYPAILTDESGERRSLWPSKWSLEYLASIEHTRSYRKNYANDPWAADGDYWSEDDFTYGVELPPGQAYTRWLLVVDPTATTKTTSDPAGLAVLAWAPEVRERISALGEPFGRLIHPAQITVMWATGVQLVGRALRKRIEQVLAAWPKITRILIETNTGGEIQAENLGGLPGVRVVTIQQTASKEVRFAEALHEYQKPVAPVRHAGKLSLLEEQMIKFPKGDHDDIADAAVSGILYFTRPPTKKRVSVRRESYGG